MSDTELPSRADTKFYWIFAGRVAGPKWSPERLTRSGKWLIYRSRDQIDDMWATIARAIERGQLGPHAKVSTTRPNPHANSDKHVICVYTSDYRDRKDVTRVLRMLRAMGIEERLFYKEDAATVAGNYRRGSASLYESSAGTDQLIARREPMPLTSEAMSKVPALTVR